MASPAIQTPAVIEELVTYVKVQEPSTIAADGTTIEGKVKVFPESEELEAAIEAQTYEELGRQTFRFYNPQTLEGCKELVTDEEEFVSLVQRGLATKLQNKARTHVLAKDFKPTEEVVDLKEAANAKSNRGLSPTEKVLKQISDLPPEARAMIAQLLAAQQAA